MSLAAKCCDVRSSAQTPLRIHPTRQGASAPKHFWDVWQLFNLGDPKGILWSALPRQLPTVLALAFVVAFGSSLDVAAIQQGSPDELDYNRELVTVGVQQLSYVASLPFHDVCVAPRACRPALPSTAPYLCCAFWRAGLSNVLAGAVGAGMTGAPCIPVLTATRCRCHLASSFAILLKTLS